MGGWRTDPLAPNPMTRVAIYAGSFDPITRGHEDLIRRSLGFVDQLVVAVASNISKQRRCVHHRGVWH